MQVTKVKYALWAADWRRCLHFYRDLFSGEVTRESEVWSEVVIAGFGRVGQIIGPVSER